MSGRTCLAIVLAAGEGTRMRSARPKVLHTVAGASLLDARAQRARRSRRDPRRGGGRARPPGGRGRGARALAEAEMFVQAERRGTAHAVLSAKAAIARGADDILVVFGDTPLIRPQTLVKLAGGDRRRRSRRGARLPAGRSDRLRPAGDRARRADPNRGTRRSERQRARHRALQQRPDGVRRQHRAGDPGADRLCTTASTSII